MGSLIVRWTVGQAGKLRPGRPAQMCLQALSLQEMCKKVATASKGAELDLNGRWALCEATIDVSLLFKDASDLK